MPELNASDVAAICGGHVVGGASGSCVGVVGDSRRVEPDVAFAAIGRRHEHVADALAAGAPFVIVDRPVAGPAVVVDDTVAALARLADRWRRMLDVRVVAITGSTGKTLTKDFVAAALRVGHVVHASPASFNNEEGVPLTVLGCGDDTDILVAEVAARHPGEIAELCALVRPRVGVITGIGSTHLAEFGSRSAIASTKAELLTSLPPDGVAVLPAADDFLGLLAGSTVARVITVGPGGTVRFHVVGMERDGRAIARVHTSGGDIVVRPPLPGRPFALNAAIAIVVASTLGIDPRDAAAAVEAAPTSSWRMQVDRVGERVLVNDAYNANPTSVAAALRTVNELAPSRERWAVLGEMAELGGASEREHARMGRLAAALGFRVVAVGPSATYGAGATTVGDADAALEALAAACARDAAVLVKASRSVGLEGLAGALAQRWTRVPATGSG